MTKPRVILEIGIGPILIIAGLILALTTFGHCEKKPLRVPVTIHIQRIDGDEIFFEPMVAPTFEGQIRGKALDAKTQSCYATTENVAALVGGGEVVNLVLVCGESKIYMEKVDFR